MNVTAAITKEYENKSNWAICENEPNSNPKQTQFKHNMPEFSPVGSKVNFHAQKIDGSVQISKISENVGCAHKGLCFIGRYRP